MNVCSLAAAADNKSPYREILLNLLEAWEAGLWCFVASRYEIVCLERPEIHEQRSQLHNETGPAISWPGEEYFFYRGIRLPDAYVITNPEKITIKDIDKERNQEIKRIKIERFGYERFMKEGGAIKAAEDETGILWHRMLNPGAPNRLMTRGNRDFLAMVEVVNGTPEPDGSFKHYWLRVPPTVQTAKEGVAWTYRLQPGEYQPQIRT